MLACQLSFLPFGVSRITKVCAKRWSTTVKFWNTRQVPVYSRISSLSRRVFPDISSDLILDSYLLFSLEDTLVSSCRKNKIPGFFSKGSFHHFPPQLPMLPDLLDNDDAVNSTHP